MIKYFCDKCGKELPLFNNEFTSDMFKITVEPPEVRRWTDNAETGSYILCYGCVRKFNKWINEADDFVKYAPAPSIETLDIPVLFSERKTDYHAKQDYGKAKLSLVPRRIIWDVAAIREYGNNKYPDGGPDNWRGVEPERYRDAAYRHFMRYLDDPHGADKESNFPHLWHLATNIAFLCEMEDMYLSKNPEVVERLKKEFWTPVKGLDKDE